jgi:hypothetical protein
MMYWTFPGVTAADRLDHSPKLDPAKIALSPEEAAARVGLQANPNAIRLNSFDGRPVYRFSGEGRGGGGGRMVYADTGAEQTEVPAEMLDRIASSWAGRPVAEAKKESVEEPDQWTVAGQLRNLRPMFRYTWPDGQVAYLDGTTGEIVQYTTFATRVAAHISAIPHWIYYTPLRSNQPLWISFMIYSSLIGTVSAIIGMIVAVWMYSPKRKYRLAGKPTGIPYKGQKRWHWILGMVFGIATVTWTFSGMMSLGPFPIVERLTGQGQRGPQQGRQRGQQSIAAALRGRVTMADFASVHPRDLLAKVADLDVKEVEWTSAAGRPVFSANLAGGKNQLLNLDGTPLEVDQQKVVEIIKSAVADPAATEIRILDQYDLYYLDRTRQRPLPVILVRMNDADHTRYYVDPRSARVVGTYSSRNWVSRWLYTGLHSLNFPFLYNYRPLWDIVVITFMIGGTALCVTSLVLAWRVLGRKLKRAAVSDVLTPVS